ncbi:dienelactone hydrolase family protein [Sphingomonas canadensis]|uniref:Dienelactone hydrolase family protein n=1 Tax=Sphingomonas canadensis TaxID=1219257 RepID=A0ABW3H6F3_9SPHN|nr:dienelactone hydrolase family protein [Sphingomonas canadensis]MCW3836390.1 dienelactone hydrolase family protein [Sphingomonas canadensis]
MCDQDTAADNDRYLSRRAFGAGVGAAGLMAMLPTPADARPLKSREVTVAMPDGSAEAYFVAPDAGRHPGVLVWPDIGGLRPAFRKMADRLAASGYAVLTVNAFYRSARPPYTQPGEAPDAPAIRERAMEYRKLLTPDAAAGDARAFIDFLDAQGEVDTARGIGTTGYCMGGPLVMQTAAARADRVRAGASFHGGGLATTAPDSPHLLIPQMKAGFLIAVAENDDGRTPEEKVRLRTAFDAAKLAAEIEVYPGTLHGWCPPDSRVYNEPQAERAWARLLALFERTLGAAA